MLEVLKTNRALELFGEMCEIPHGSSDTKKISDYLKDFAKKNELDCIQDEYNNIVIKKAATHGKENVMPLIIQAHMDMVCEKEDGVEFDFKKDALRLKYENDYLFADGTTLGADDISGVALGLAILEDKDLSHGPITCIFTTDEEIGMLGAVAMDKSYLKGEAYVLNIDNEKEGIFLTSCAGGVMAEGDLSLELCDKAGTYYEIVISGCIGGHSGDTIHKGSANAITLLGDVLQELDESFEIEISSIEGGTKDNAIPRKATAIICCNDEKFVKEFEFFAKNNVHRFKETDPELKIELKPLGESTNKIIINKSAVISYIYDVPNGVIKFSDAMPGMVETSLNFGIIRTNENTLHVCHLLRSSVSKDLDLLLNQVLDLLKTKGFIAKSHSGYPAWEHKAVSKFRDIIEETCKKIEMSCTFMGIHAGLECGVFYDANPELDIVSFGPSIHDIHTPAEKMSISSFNRCFDFVKELISNL